MLANSVDEQAASWAVRSAHGEMPAESRAQLEAWLAADRRHRGAYLRAQAGLHLVDQAVIHGRPVTAHPEAAGTQANSRFGTLCRWSVRMGLGGAALAACVAALLDFGIQIFPAATHAPAAGVVMNLKDGSIVTLGKDARIEVAMSDGERRITLLSGEANFNVAKDRSRPFVVRSGGVYAQATGTEYSVRRLGDDGGAVRVSEGSVLVWVRNEREQAVLLHPGDELSINPATEVATNATSSPAVAQVSLDDVSIASAVARFNSLNQTQISIEDPKIGDVRIIGLFNAHDPEQFAQAAAVVAGANVVHRGSTIVLQRK